MNHNLRPVAPKSALSLATRDPALTRLTDWVTYADVSEEIVPPIGRIQVRLAMAMGWLTSKPESALSVPPSGVDAYWQNQASNLIADNRRHLRLTLDGLLHTSRQDALYLQLGHTIVVGLVEESVNLAGQRLPDSAALDSSRAFPIFPKQDVESIHPSMKNILQHIGRQLSPASARLAARFEHGANCGLLSLNEAWDAYQVTADEHDTFEEMMRRGFENDIFS